ncbi:MAG: ACT domain-containing protein [Phycisphaerales bacterium]|nr:MAG: ACT domain-containing protein [Phycisphaerales bacterium]
MSFKAVRHEQISVFLENRAGVIAEVCNALTDQRINIEALTVLDTFDIATMRMVVDEADLAKEALRTAGAAYVSVPVLGIRLPNVPGSLGAVGNHIAQAGVNIEYLYASSIPGGDTIYAILRVGDADIDKVLDIDFDIETTH